MGFLKNLGVGIGLSMLIFLGVEIGKRVFPWLDKLVGQGLPPESVFL